MKKFLLIFLLCAYGISQTNCELCVEQGGFYCGDDESNWTQYSPNGCVPNGLDGLFYLNSWVNEEQNICFQLMETNDEKLFQTWIDNWSDLTDFEVITID